MTLFSTGRERELENLRIINARFARKPRPKVVRGERQGPLVLRPGVLPPIVIAAVDTISALKPYANYVCTGINDEVTIGQAILDMDLYVAGAAPEAFQKTYGTIVFLNGTYIFDARLTLDYDAYGRLKFIGDGMPKFVMSYNTNGADGYAPLISIPGGGNAFNYPLIFENIEFDGGGLSNAICFLQRLLTTKPLVVVRSCHFTNWDNVLWSSERLSPRNFHDNTVENCDFADACFHYEGFTSQISRIHDNLFKNCSGNMVSGGGFAFHALFSNNVQIGGTMVLNALAGVTYQGNVF